MPGGATHVRVCDRNERIALMAAVTRRLLIPVVTAMLALTAASGCAGTYATSHSSGCARSTGHADESAFHEALSPCGDWIRSAEYGLAGRHIRHRLLPRHQSLVLVVHARNITTYTMVDNHVANRSLDVDPIGRASRDQRVLRARQEQKPQDGRGADVKKNRK